MSPVYSTTTPNIPTSPMSLSNGTTTTTSTSLTPSSHSSANTSTSSLLFGSLAVAIGLVTIWQAHRAWTNHHRDSVVTTQRGNIMPALELDGVAPSRSDTASTFHTEDLVGPVSDSNDIPVQDIGQDSDAASVH